MCNVSDHLHHLEEEMPHLQVYEHMHIQTKTITLQTVLVNQLFHVHNPLQEQRSQQFIIIIIQIHKSETHRLHQ